MDRGAWRATIHRVTKSQTGLSDLAQDTSKMLVQMTVLFPLPSRSTGTAWHARKILSFGPRKTCQPQASWETLGCFISEPCFCMCKLASCFPPCRFFLGMCATLNTQELPHQREPGRSPALLPGSQQRHPSGFPSPHCTSPPVSSAHRHKGFVPKLSPDSSSMTLAMST